MQCDSTMLNVCHLSDNHELLCLLAHCLPLLAASATFAGAWCHTTVSCRHVCSVDCSCLCAYDYQLGKAVFASCCFCSALPFSVMSGVVWLFAGCCLPQSIKNFAS